MSKDHIQDVVRKSLEKYFRDLGEQEPHNVYDMVVLTVERPMLEVSWHALKATSRTRPTCWALIEIPCAKSCSSMTCSEPLFFSSSLS